MKGSFLNKIFKKEGKTTMNIEDYITINKKVLKGLLLKVSIVLMVAITIIVMGLAVAKTMKYPETISAHSIHDFMIELESGNEERLEDYRDRYIENDYYLFNGDITFRLMCEKYDLDIEMMKYMYEKSEYESIQSFFNNVIKGNY